MQRFAADGVWRVVYYEAEILLERVDYFRGRLLSTFCIKCKGLFSFFISSPPNS